MLVEFFTCMVEFSLELQPVEYKDQDVLPVLVYKSYTGSLNIEGKYT